MNKLNCIIIDDEPAAREGLEEYVQGIQHLNLIGSFSNALKIPIEARNKIDLLFLDIEMPRLNGIEYLKSLVNPPLVIFTTAYSEYALQGYDLDIVDYLLKPITFDRFTKAVTKAYEISRFKNREYTKAFNETNHLFVKTDKVYEKVSFSDILFIEASQNYSLLRLKERKLLTYSTLSSIESFLPSDIFMRIHKSYVVNMLNIDAANGEEVQIGNTILPVSKNYKEALINYISKRTFNK